MIFLCQCWNFGMRFHTWLPPANSGHKEKAACAIRPFTCHSGVPLSSTKRNPRPRPMASCDGGSGSCCPVCGLSFPRLYTELTAMARSFPGSYEKAKRPRLESTPLQSPYTLDLPTARLYGKETVMAPDGLKLCPHDGSSAPLVGTSIAASALLPPFQSEKNAI